MNGDKLRVLLWAAGILIGLAVTGMGGYLTRSLSVAKEIADRVTRVEVRSMISEVKAEFKEDLQEVKTDLKAAMKENKDDIKDLIRSLRP